MTFEKSTNLKKSLKFPEMLGSPLRHELAVRRVSGHHTLNNMAMNLSFGTQLQFIICPHFKFAIEFVHVQCQAKRNS